MTAEKVYGPIRETGKPVDGAISDGPPLCPIKERALREQRIGPNHKLGEFLPMAQKTSQGPVPVSDYCATKRAIFRNERESTNGVLCGMISTASKCDVHNARNTEALEE